MLFAMFSCDMTCSGDPIGGDIGGRDIGSSMSVSLIHLKDNRDKSFFLGLANSSCVWAAVIKSEEEQLLNSQERGTATGRVHSPSGQRSSLWNWNHRSHRFVVNNGFWRGASMRQRAVLYVAFF